MPIKTAVTIYDGEELKPKIQNYPSFVALSFEDTGHAIYFNDLEGIEHFVELLKVEVVKEKERKDG